MKYENQPDAHLYNTFGLSDEMAAKKAMVALLKNLEKHEKPSRSRTLFNHFSEILIDITLVMILGFFARIFLNISGMGLMVISSALLVSLTIARVGICLTTYYVENSSNQINTLKAISVAVWALHNDNIENRKS